MDLTGGLTWAGLLEGLVEGVVFIFVDLCDLFMLIIMYIVDIKEIKKKTVSHSNTFLRVSPKTIMI